MSLNSLPPLVFKSFIGFDELFDEISKLDTFDKVIFIFRLLISLLIFENSADFDG